MSIHEHLQRQRSKSLDELEGTNSSTPGPHDSGLVHRCLHLRRKPIGEFDSGDLRIMIGQREGLMFLLPLAIECLESDPLVEATFYPGDLLCAVLTSSVDFWRRNPELRRRIEAVVATLPEVPEFVAEAITIFNSRN